MLRLPIPQSSGVDFKAAARRANKRARRSIRTVGRTAGAAAGATTRTASRNGRVASRRRDPAKGGLATLGGPVTQTQPPTVKLPGNRLTPLVGKSKKKRTTKETPPQAPAAPRSGAAGSPPPVAGSGGASAAPRTGGGSGGGGASTTTKRTPTTPAAGPASDTGNTTTASTTATDSVADLYAPARRELERQRASLDAVKKAEMDDWNAYNTWLESKQTAAEANLTAQQAQIAQQAQAREAETNARIQSFTDSARRLVGGNIPDDMRQQSGLDAVNASQGYTNAADVARNAYLDNSQIVNSRNLMDQREVAKARAAGVFANIGTNYSGSLAKLASAGTDLEQKQAEATLNDKYKQQQLSIDQQAADFLQGIKTGELDVKRANAETARLKVNLSAKQQQAALRLRAQIAQGDMDYKSAMIDLKRKGYSLAKRKQIWNEANGSSGATDGNNPQKIRQEASKYMKDWARDNVPETGWGTGQPAIQLGYNAVAALAGVAPTLRAEQARRILSGWVPGHVMKDNRILSSIAESFR